MLMIFNTMDILKGTIKAMQSGMVLKALRKDRKLTQSDIAALLKTSRQYYSDYECEKFELPLHHLIFLADYYHVSTDYLLGKTSIRTPYQAILK